MDLIAKFQPGAAMRNEGLSAEGGAGTMKKIVSLILPLILALALLPVTAYALPRTFDKSRIHRLDDYRVTLTIGEMTFQGEFTNAELTDEKLEDLVRKVLAEMSLGEADFDLLNDLVNTMNQHNTITPEQMQKLFDRWFDMIGPVPVLGQVTTLVQVVMQINKGDLSGPAQGAAEEAVSQFAEGFVEGVAEGLEDYSGKLGKVAGSALGIGKALKAAVEGMLESNSGERAMDRALGLEAYKLINDFYARLNREVDRHYEENAANFMVKFDAAKAEKPFKFFDTQNTERWTLNMTLFQTESYNRLDIDGKYEGQYAIEIQYDLSGFQDGLDDILQTEEWRKTYAFPEWEDNWGPFHTVVTNSGTCDVKRTLEGYATAVLYRKGGSCSIRSAQDGDRKDVNVSGIVFQASAGDANGRMDNEWSISADDGAFTNTSRKGTIQFPDYVYEGPPGEHVNTIPWDGSIWRRANNADRNWKITLTPLQRK